MAHGDEEREGVPELDGDTEGLPDTVVVTDEDTDALPVTDAVELPETDAVEDSVAKLERVAPPIGDAVTQLELEVVGDTEREGADEGVCDAVPHIVIEPAEVAEEAAREPLTWHSYLPEAPTGAAVPAGQVEQTLESHKFEMVPALHCSHSCV